MMSTQNNFNEFRNNNQEKKDFSRSKQQQNPVTNNNQSFNNNNLSMYNIEGRKNEIQVILYILCIHI